MDRKIQKLKDLTDEYLYKSKEDILVAFGKPSQKFDETTFFYDRYKLLFFKDEITFIFKEDKVVDIAICEYFLWKGIRSIFYYENQTPEYKVFRIK